jgi:hypothetical protein
MINLKKNHQDPDFYAKTLYSEGLKCSDIIYATDRVQTAVKVINVIDDIWVKGNCDGLSLKVLFFL